MSEMSDSTRVMQSRNTWQTMSLFEVTSLYTNTGIQSCSSLIHCSVPTTISWKSANMLIIYAMSLLACGTLVPASLHKCDRLYRSFRTRVFPVNHLHWHYWQPNLCQLFSDCTAHTCKVFSCDQSQHPLLDHWETAFTKCSVSIELRYRTSLSHFHDQLGNCDNFYILCRWLIQLIQHVPVNPIQYVVNSLFIHFCLFFQPALKLVLIYFLSTLYHN